MLSIKNLRVDKNFAILIQRNVTIRMIDDIEPPQSALTFNGIIVIPRLLSEYLSAFQF